MIEETPQSIPPFASFPRELLSLVPERIRVDQEKQRVRHEQVSQSVVVLVIEPIERPKWLDYLLQEA